MVVAAPRDCREKFHYEMECVLRMFLPEEPVRFAEGVPVEGDWIRIVTEPQPDGCRLNRAELFMNRHLTGAQERSQADDQAVERCICRLLFRLLTGLTGKTIDWGVLTGVRPVKLLRELREKGNSEAEVRRIFMEELLVTGQKFALCADTAAVQQPVLRRLNPQQVSLYVSIPFCPSRCSYCSFVSHSIEKTRRLIPDYLERLKEELGALAGIVKRHGFRLQTIYIGGGTPTVLEADQLRSLLQTICCSFDLSACEEFSVEAGRPDTITTEKLKALSEYRVGRISINPQTLHDDVLQRIGRKHTVQQFYEAYNAAKQFDFTTVNVDLIAGLDGDSLESFCQSLEAVIGLQPQNITVHALTMKRAAAMFSEMPQKLNAVSPTAEMIQYSQRALSAAGFSPYYLYRQKNSIDSLENVGFAKPGHPCLYNIFMMDECQTILSAGAGGVSKLLLPGNRIERIFNYKYPYEYLSGFETILKRKDKISTYFPMPDHQTE